jgi:hypothetical protein
MCAEVSQLYLALAFCRGYMRASRMPQRIHEIPLLLAALFFTAGMPTSVSVPQHAENRA